MMKINNKKQSIPVDKRCYFKALNLKLPKLYIFYVACILKLFSSLRSFHEDCLRMLTMGWLLSLYVYRYTYRRKIDLICWAYSLFMGFEASREKDTQDRISIYSQIFNVPNYIVINI
jgi:hypothetical protein